MYLRIAVYLCAVIIAGLESPSPYSDGPPPAHTGGFGEPTCHRCHGDQHLNQAETVLFVELPEQYEPGTSYRVTIRLGRAGMKAAGFQVSARIADGDLAGNQAGHFESLQEDVRIVSSETPAVEYASHTRVKKPKGDGEARWVLEWLAPDHVGPVVFHVAANAANDDDSEFGDHIVTSHFISVPTGQGSNENRIGTDTNRGKP